VEERSERLDVQENNDFSQEVHVRPSV
jgi:hypothetical protein